MGELFDVLKTAHPTSNTVGLSLLILIKICRWLFRCRLVEVLDAVVASIFTTALLFTIAFLSRN